MNRLLKLIETSAKCIYGTHMVTQTSSHSVHSYRLQSNIMPVRQKPKENHTLIRVLAVRFKGTVTQT